MNSGPLSTLIILGRVLYRQICSRVRITREEGRDVSTSIASTSLLKSSIMFNKRYLRPSQRLSDIKSILHTWLTDVGWNKACFTLAGNLFFALRRILSFISVYTRYTFLWFQVCPCSLNRLKLLSNPMEGCFVTISSKALIMAVSSFGFGLY